MGKVLKASDVEHVGSGKKQDIYIADHRGTVKVTLWEENIGILKEKHCYRLENFVVREWGNTKYLAVYNDSEVILMEDEGMADIPVVDPTIKKELHDAEIVGVLQLDRYLACMQCGARVEPSCDQVPGRCSVPECVMLQKLDFCKLNLSVKLMLIVKPGSFTTLSIQSQVLLSLTNVSKESKLSEENLLMLPVLHKVTYNDRGLITAVDI